VVMRASSAGQPEAGRARHFPWRLTRQRHHQRSAGRYLTIRRWVMFSRTLHPRPRNRRCRPSQAAVRSIGYGRPGTGGITVVTTGLAGQQHARSAKASGHAQSAASPAGQQRAGNSCFMRRWSRRAARRRQGPSSRA
jgi:hypothetical protein